MVLSDMIQQKANSEVLKDASLSLKYTFDAVKEMVMIVDERFLVVRANRAVVEFLGKPMEEITGKSCRELFHESSVPPKDCPLLQLKQKKIHREYEFFFNEKNTWIECVIDPIFNQSEMLVGSVYVLRNVTQRKHAQDLLKESEAKFKEIAELLPQIIYEMDLTGKLTFVNKQALESCKY